MKTLNHTPKTKTLDEQIKEMERELQMRERYYPEWIQGPNPRLSPVVAQHRLDCVKATLQALRSLKEKEAKQQSIF
jgi:hypothetical protein